ncbi:porin family protein [Crenobacter cavernae]|uniref:Porin family protein n=1 Tax=Crenobacter cavernae TaxID=2290923 RepID=A0A345Y4I3_9NEIS|nr:porin family protein [Crenobacter cavernae]AXK38835.1 porin family protein [Crenobacter cavernae]
MKLTRTLLIASTLIAAAGAAQAADTGLYGYGNLGHTDQKPEGLKNAKDRDGSGGLGLGYRVNDNFAVEGGYANYGKTKANNGEIKRDGARVAALGILPLNDKVDVYGSASANYVHTKGTVNGVSRTANDWAPGVGVGVGYKLTDRVGVRAGYDRIMNVGDKALKTDMNAYNVGVTARF